MSVKKTRIIGTNSSPVKPLEAVTEEVAYSEQIIFKPDDFKLLTLSSGGMVYALPVNLPSHKVTKGDIVMVEWRTFKAEQKITEF
jgi:hypothetical protein